MRKLAAITIVLASLALGLVYAPYETRGVLSALLIVFGGTLGALLVSLPLSTLRSPRPEDRAQVLQAVASFAPTLGIIGTVMGLVNILLNLADTSSTVLVTSMLFAFVSTLAGIAVSYVALWRSKRYAV